MTRLTRFAKPASCLLAFHLLVVFPSGAAAQEAEGGAPNGIAWKAFGLGNWTRWARGSEEDGNGNLAIFGGVTLEALHRLRLEAGISAYNQLKDVDDSFDESLFRPWTQEGKPSAYASLEVTPWPRELSSGVWLSIGLRGLAARTATRWRSSGVEPNATIGSYSIGALAKLDGEPSGDLRVTAGLFGGIGRRTLGSQLATDRFESLRIDLIQTPDTGFRTTEFEGFIRFDFRGWGLFEFYGHNVSLPNIDSNGESGFVVSARAGIYLSGGTPRGG